MHVLGINGVGTDGSGTTDTLLQTLELLGHTAVDCNYRETRLGRFQTYDRGRQFADAVQIARRYWPAGGCVVVAHSRGCLVAWRMWELGYLCTAAFLFRPAMNRDFFLPRGQHRVVCIHSPQDRAIKWGKRLPFNDFGDAGRFGFLDERIENIEAPVYSEREFWRHNDDFLYPQVDQWAVFIHRRLERL
jgi:hypothetical protein